MEIYRDKKRALVVEKGVLSVVGNKNIRIGLADATTSTNLPADFQAAVKKQGNNPADYFVVLGYSGRVEGCFPVTAKEAIEKAIADRKAETNDAKAKQEEQRQAREDAARAACPAGYVMARQNWSNGDLCAAEYETEDGTKIIASDLLESNNGWYYLPVADVEEEKAKQRVQSTKQESEKAALESEWTAKFAQAKDTKKPVMLQKWITNDCTANLPDCSFDVAIKWAMPDGTTKTEYTHCY